MNSLNKKIILAALVVAEIASGSYFIYQYQQYKIKQSNILGESKVAIIDKTQTITNENEDIKYIWRFTPNQKQEDNPDWLPYKAVYNINGDALNDLNDYPIEKKESTFRIITLGDSFTYGHYVNTEDNWTEQLEIMLNDHSNKDCYKKIEVINLGMPGYDTQYIVQRYKETGQKYNPDLILWFESGSGFYRNNELMQPLIEECTSLTYSDYKDTRSKYSYCWTKTKEQIKKQYSDQDLNNIIQKNYDTFFELTNTIKTIIFYYKYLPNYENEKVLNSWKNIYQDEAFINLVPNPTKKEQLFDGHPNKLGHEVIATHIYEYIKNEKIICQ